MVQHDWKKVSTKANRAERPGGIVEDLTELEYQEQRKDV
jgi:hypothetical protein